MEILIVHVVLVVLDSNNAWVVIFANANLAPFSIAIHLTAIQPLYAKNARPATNNPTTTAAILKTFLIA